jgi:hypothetical protein
MGDSMIEYKKKQIQKKKKDILKKKEVIIKDGTAGSSRRT